MTNWLLASTIILWVCVIFLGLVIYALVRQVGILYERVAPAGALSVNKQVVVNQPAPALTLIESNKQSSLTIGGMQASGRSQLLFFVAPSCPVCKTLLPIAKSVAKSESDWVDLILASDDSEQEIAKFIQDQNLQDYSFINSELLGKSLGVSKLPYAVLIDEMGVIKALGLVNSREHIESLFNAKETGYASLQEFMQQNYA